MDILELVGPTMKYKEQVMAFKAEMLEYGSDFDGCSGLREAETYEQWLDFRGREEAKGWAPSRTWLAVRRPDSRGVGTFCSSTAGTSATASARPSGGRDTPRSSCA